MWKWIQIQSHKLTDAWERPEGTPPTHIGQAYRTCLYRIYEKACSAGKTVLSVASPRQGDGRTSFAILLGVTAASLTQQKVALIDANFVRPALHTALDLDLAPGLSEALHSPGTTAPILHTSPFAGLDVLTAGHHLFKKQLLLEKEEMKKVIQTLRASYGLILVDTPAVVEAGGLVRLAGEVDGTILLVRRRANRIKELEQVKRLAEESTLPIIGAVHYQAH